MNTTADSEQVIISQLLQLKELLKKHQLEAHIDDLLVNTLPAEISAFLSKYPLVLEALKEAREADAKSRSLKVKLVDYITGLPNHVLHQRKGFALGIITCCLGFVSYNALQPNTLCEIAPQGVYPALLAVASLYAAPKIFNVIKLPTNGLEALTMKLINLGLKIMPWAPVVHKVLEKREVQLNHAVTVESLDYYKQLIDSLKVEQKTLLSKSWMLLRIQVNPRALLGELTFLDSLDNDQMYYAYQFLLLSGTKPHKDFETLKASLNAEQTAAIQPENRELLAEYNPLIFCFNTKFMDLLDEDQLLFFKN